MLIGAGIAAAVVVVAVVLAVVLGGGGSSSALPKGTPAVGTLQGALPNAAYVDSLFKGIPQKGTALGRSSAPVTMVEFIDLQCPYCQEFETQLLPTLLEKYVRTGVLRIQMQPWAFIGPDSLRGQAAVLAAARQDRAFNYAELLYTNQGTENTGWLDDAMVAAAARSVPGLRVHRLWSERSSAAVKAAQSNVDALASTDKISGTPTLFVGKTGGTPSEVTMSSPTDESALVAAIRSAQA